MGSRGSNPNGGIMEKLTIIRPRLSTTNIFEKVLITLPIWRWENNIADYHFLTSIQFGNHGQISILSRFSDFLILIDLVLK